MAGLVVVDTDLVIDFLRGKGAGAVLVRELIIEHRFRITAITAFELRVGADFLARRDAILRLGRSRTFPLDPDSALHAGEIAATLRSAGEDIGMADCLQAGICLRYALPLATRNRKHFSRVAGLRLFDVDA
ncbi:type II toxin-antitoxin system VapC family toxin [Mycolicibacter icosiumassiliensis]|uniref:type II toxin-antitoxin system VapC family toxin n=1 Tax=Mycolicibacter icosiumassiliensis TaxID=1792835 RepID=UPI000829CED8|nr:type II toxin-antitoxin system VapC family toxin [Mycolicibacter icosiumassiliensis]